MRKKNTRKRFGHQFDSSTTDYIFERDGGLCIYCGKWAQEVDHVIPKMDGGPSIRANAVCVCRYCNRKKHHHPDNLNFLIKAIFWLETHGEDTRWMNEFYPEKTTLQITEKKRE